MQSHHKALLAGCASAAFALGLATVAQAQAADAGRASGQLDEIVVTARKVSESLTNTPVAVGVLTGADLKSRGVFDYKGLSSFSPGMRFENQTAVVNARSFNTFVIRGIYPGTDNPERQTVGVFLDGVPLGGGGALSDLNNLERVEVVNGPQSAYFGRSTFAGAINFIPRPVSMDYHANVDVSVASFGTRDAKAYVEGPLIRDVLAARVAVRGYKTDGEYKNVGYPGNLGERSTSSVTANVLFKPVDSLRVRGFFSAWADKDGPSAQSLLGPAFYNCNAGAGRNGANNYICGGQSSSVLSQMSQNTALPAAEINKLLTFAKVTDPTFLGNAGLKRRARVATIIADYDIPGGYALSVSASNGRNLFSNIIDQANQAPAVPYSLAQTAYDIRNKTAEARISSPQWGRFKVLAGFNYFHQENRYEVNFNRNGGVTSSNPITLATTDNYGLFGSVNVALTDKLTLSLEGRRQLDRLSQGVLLATGAQAKGEFWSTTPRAILQYNIRPDLMVYASYSKGTRPGQFNTNVYSLSPPLLAAVQAVTPVPLSVPQEYLKMYEGGLKGYFLDRRLRVLSAIYYGDYTDKQVAVNVPYFNGATPVSITVVLPKGSLELHGVELQAAFKVMTGLTVEGTYAYSESKIRDYSCTDCLAVTGVADPKGNRLPRYPAQTASLSGSYERNVFNDYDGYARLDYIFTGRQYELESNKAWVEASSRFNLHVGVRNARYTAELWGTNIFDDKTPSNISRATDPFTGVNVLKVSPADRATFGVRLAATY